MEQAERRAFLRATEWALEWHRDQKRKGSEIPYFSHLAQVAGLVLEHGGDGGQAVGALLHDSLEDAASSAERADRERQIESEFRPDVLRSVHHCTDPGAEESLDPKRPWKERKEHYLAHLGDCDDQCLLVAACDKRHNLHAIVWDVRTQGLGYLDRFRGDPRDQLWYFEGIAHTLAESTIPQRLKNEIAFLLEDFKTLICDPSSPG